MKDVKVRFELEILEDDFPPISVEILNARAIDDHRVVLDNTPFFADSVAVDDVLRCRKTELDHVLQYESVITPSGNKSISIIFIDDNCKEEIYQYLKEGGCYCEYGEFYGYNMLAVSVNKDLDYEKVMSYLDQHEESGRISYAELCI